MANPLVSNPAAYVPSVALSFGPVGGAAVTVDAAHPLPVSAGLPDYETIAAGQADQVMGTTGAAGDVLGGLLIVPASTSPGGVSIKDGAGGAISVFTGGAASLSNLVPFFVPLAVRSLAGPWKVTTGANVSAVAIGDFS